MKWFEKQEIKDQQLLTEEQITYLKKPSLAICGPFNFIARKHKDFLLASVFFLVCDPILEALNFPVLIVTAYSILNMLLLLGLFYFFVKHGRRLSWNRNKWKDFEALQKSETKWLSAALGGVGFYLFREFAENRKENVSSDPELILFSWLGFALFLTAIFLPFVCDWWNNRKKVTLSQTEEFSSKDIQIQT